jgi:uncharacterized protein YceK
MKKISFGLVAIFVAMAVNGCGSVIGDAGAGPDPGGGFYDGPNINVGHVDPVSGGFYYHPYINIGQAVP